ncbi:MAG: hypothetical protein QOC75_1710, partial [Pseudonocardiales bacterium]|nr:hypothetical protein [Pseudonocardiales bacterium]
ATESEPATPASNGTRQIGSGLPS